MIVLFVIMSVLGNEIQEARMEKQVIQVYHVVRKRDHRAILGQHSPIATRRWNTILLRPTATCPERATVVSECHGFVNRSAIGVGIWRFVEGGEHGGAIQDGGSTSLPSFRSRNGGEILRAAIIHYKATSARLQ
jgi:hypothetical protein